MAGEGGIRSLAVPAGLRRSARRQRQYSGGDVAGRDGLSGACRKERARLRKHLPDACGVRRWRAIPLQEADDGVLALVELLLELRKILPEAFEAFVDGALGADGDEGRGDAEDAESGNGLLQLRQRHAEQGGEIGNAVNGAQVIVGGDERGLECVSAVGVFNPERWLRRK